MCSTNKVEENTNKVEENVLELVILSEGQLLGLVAYSRWCWKHIVAAACMFILFVMIFVCCFVLIYAILSVTYRSL